MCVDIYRAYLKLISPRWLKGHLDINAIVVKLLTGLLMNNSNTVIKYKIMHNITDIFNNSFNMKLYHYMK